MTGDEIRTLVSSGFDADYYVREYPDIRAAGYPPLDHYLQYGWQEGRFPSAHFAACASLFDMAELRAMGIDPFALFLLVRATSQPLVKRDSDAALEADPLASFRVQGHVRHAAMLAGGVDWSGVTVEPTCVSPYRVQAARLRLALNAYVGRPLVILPDREWPGAPGIARALDESHVAFLHFGDAASVDGWREVLSNVVGLPSAFADEQGVVLLLIDVLRGVAPPLVVDMGAHAVRTALTRHSALFQRESSRLVAFGPQPDDPPGFEGIEWITRVALAPDVAAAILGDSAVDPSAGIPGQLRDILTEIRSHGV